MEINVLKRDGKLEKFNADKVHKVIEWAIKGLKDVSLSDIEINAKLNYKDGITSKEIHEVLIDSAANLISLENSDYQYVASRLLNYSLRKDVWGGKNPPKLINLIKENIESGIYDKEILNWYTKDEINKIDEFIDHERDFNFTYAGIKQLCDKYLLKNVETKLFYETPQFRFIVAGMTVFHRYNKDVRMTYVRRFYNYVSKFKINLATPVLGKLGTPDKSYASCCLIEFLDDKNSIDAMNQAVSAATYNSYGIGVNFGRMRAIGSSINNGKLFHPGVIPFLKIVESEVKAWSQLTRGGSATITFPIFHYEIEDIIQLKNSTSGTYFNRVFNLDYSVSISKLFYERFIKDETITLFSPSEVRDLYDNFGLDNFDELYCKYEKDKSIKLKKVVKARDLFQSIAKEKLETGRIYTLNIDNVNSQGTWIGQVNMSNLCQEVLHQIDPIKNINDETGEIGTCILSSINWLETTEKELEKVCDVVVRMLDEIIDIQDYFSVSAKNFSHNKRSIGVGVTNLAAFLASHDIKYSSKDAPNLIDEWMEKQQYFLIKASIDLAKEKGKCLKFNTSKYSQGILPIDKYKKDVDLVVTRKPSMDWEYLRKEIKEFGMRHTTLTCIMPVESSSVTQNATNGIEPARKLHGYKGSKKGAVPFLVPNAKSWKNRYELAFDMKNNIGYLNIAAALQKWVDMAISINVYYNPENYSDKKIPYKDIISDMLYHYKMGGKTIYYTNTEDGNKHFKEEIKQDINEGESSCSSGACTL